MTLTLTFELHSRLNVKVPLDSPYMVMGYGYGPHIMMFNGNIGSPYNDV